MKKTLSVLIAVLMMSAAFAQIPTRTVNSVRTNGTTVKQALTVSSRHAGTMAAAKETQDIVCISYTAVPYNFDGQITSADSGDVYDWWTTLTAADGSVFHFDVICSTPLVSGHTYTMEDMVAEFTWGRLAGEATGWGFASATFTYTQDLDGVEHVVAQAVDSNGNVYNITYSTPSMENAIDTIEVAVVNPNFADYSSVDGDFYFTGYTADSAYVAQIDYYGTTVAGTYTYDDFNVSYTKVYYRDLDGNFNSVGNILAGNLTVTDQAGVYDVDAYLMDINMHAYHVTMSYTVPVATDTVDVLVPTAMLQTVAGSYYTPTSHNWTGASSDSTYNVAITYTGSDTIGDFAFIYLSSSSNINNINFVDGHFSVEATDDGYTLESYLIGSDMHCYHITMHYTIPTMEDATDTIDVVIPAAMLADYTTSSGVYQMRGYTVDENTYVTVAIYSNQVPGSYEFEDFYLDYTYVYDVLTENKVNTVAGHATVTATATGYEMDAYLLGIDMHAYHVTMTYSFPVATDTIEVVCDGQVLLRDYSEYDGSYQFIGNTSDSLSQVAVNYFASQIAGSFTWDDCDASYSGVVYNGESKEVYSGDFTVTATENGYSIEGYLLCTDNVCYHFTMTYTEDGINTANKVAVNVYPNPATDVLHVEANGITRIDVIDLAGRIVLSNTQALNTVNVSGLANGVYMLRTTTTEGVNVQKIVKK